MPQGSLFDTRTARRIFALDPTTKGFGYVIFDLPFRLIHWGLSRIRGEKRSGALARFEELLARWRPDAIVLEDWTAPGSLRRPRMRALLEELFTRGRSKGLEIRKIARAAVLRCFAPEDGQISKHEVAERLAADFPKLRPRLPRVRKPWQSENEMISVFDALALAVTAARAPA